MMHGDIRVDSVYGEGSCFSVRIPQEVVSYERMGDFKKKFQDSTRRRKGYRRSFVAPEAKVLVVDDNQMNLKVAKALLKETLVQVTLCESGQECLSLLKEQMFDIILLDHMMPVMDGIETLNRIKEMEAPDCRRIPVIALTANAISGVRSKYLDAGFDAYLSKPIVGDTLETLLCKYIPREKIKFIKETEAAETADISKDEKRVEGAAAVEAAENRGKGLILNIENGLMYSGDSEEIYGEFLAMFRDMWPEKAAALQKAYEERDMAQYAILVHAAKSNAFSIGGDLLGELAKKLEHAAKKGDWTFVESYHRDVLDLYEKTAGRADEWLKKSTKTTD